MLHENLSRAWSLRSHNEPVRSFHGPGEGRASLQNVTIDSFLGHHWITWLGPIHEPTLSVVARFLEEKGALSAVVQEKSGAAPAELPRAVLGRPPEIFECTENGLKLRLRFQGARHPGLFLDHAPLRRWLMGSCRGLDVLNTFCYTGSLSVAAARAGASSITNLDLSKPAVEWSRENFELNSFSGVGADFISGDVFEWLPRFAKKGRKFGCVIADPPSSSHGSKGHFSTKKNLAELAAHTMRLVAPGGYLVLSINSHNVSWSEFSKQVADAAAETGFVSEEISRIVLPPEFPVKAGEEGYLKGVILKARG